MAFDVEGARAAGYTDAEIIAHLAKSGGFDVAGAKKAGYSEGEIIAHLAGGARPAAQPPQQQSRSTAQEIGRQVGLTARAGVEGIAGLAGVITDPVVALINKALPDSAQIPPAQQSAAALLTAAGVPQPENPLERIVQNAAQSMAGGAGMAGVGRLLAGASAPVAQAVGQQLMAAPLQNVAGSAGAGLAGQAAQEYGAGPVGQVAAALAGGVAGAGLAGIRQGQARQVSGLNEATSRGIPVMTSDVNPPTTFVGKTAQQFGERIPVAGTASSRVQQQSARVEAVRNLLREFGADDAANATDATMADLARKRSADLSKYSALKAEVIERLAPAGPVDVSRTVAAIDDQIGRLSSLRTQEVAPIIQRLDDWKRAIQGQNISNIELLRRQIGEAFKAPELQAVRSTGEKALSSIYGPLRQDMGDHIKAVGDRRDLAKWSVANSRLSGLAGELQNGTLKSVLTRGDATPEAVKQLLFSAKPSDAKALYRNLGPQGKTNAKMAILAKALDDAGGMEQLSPEKFMNSLKRLGSPIGVFFQGADKAQIDGLVKALQLTSRASQANVMPQTGAQLALPVGAAFLADFLGSGGAAVASGLTIGGLARVYESAPVRNALLRLSNAKGEEQAAALKRLVQAIQSANANQSGAQ